MRQLSLVYDFVNPKDAERTQKLTGDLRRVYAIMQDGKTHLVSDIAKILNLPECSVSAQIRHLRKQKYGGYNVVRKSLTKGVSIYQLIK